MAFRKRSAPSSLAQNAPPGFDAAIAAASDAIDVPDSSPVIRLIAAEALAPAASKVTDPPIAASGYCRAIRLVPQVVLHGSEIGEPERRR
jgi:hypothetical protein